MFRCKLSVRSLVEFVYQSGDLISVSSSMERANLGSRIHRQLQAAASGDYESEVFLKEETILDPIIFEIEGRADGILKEGNQVTIEEIKTTAIPYEDINDHNLVHFAQAYCYGYLYMQSHPIEELTIRVTYYQIETEQIKFFDQRKTRAELETFYMDTLRHFMKWARLTRDIHEQANTTLKDLVFPFPSYRSGQREFAVAVYKTILDEEVLYAQAPTGIGKTISTLFPSLKAIGEGKAEKIFYLCAKNITASVAYDTLQLLYKQKVHFKTVGITAKDKICFQEERNCDPSECPYAKGYYDRSKDALYELVNAADFLSRDLICEVAHKHEVCPFELNLDASLYANVIVGDYNYLFDPRVYLKRFFTDPGDYIFLVDEAHNLVDRAREMYSADLQKSMFLEMKRFVPKDRTLLQRAIGAINKELLELRKRCEEANKDFLAQQEVPSSLKMKLASFIEHTDAYLQSEHDPVFDEDIKTLYFQAINFNKIMDFYDEHFVTYMQKNMNDLYLKLFCMNPNKPIREMLGKGKAAVFFSATLSPIDYYLTLLGGHEESKRLSLPTPFDPHQVKLIVNNAISTKYNQREYTVDAIIDVIYQVILAKSGNYIVFAPSYAYMKLIHDAFVNKYPAVETYLQESGMNEEERQDFLELFDDVEKPHLLFCVMGGMFSEGIDLKEDKLIGAILIGVGLPQINPQQDLIRDHFNEINQMGYAYAYQFPGMNKVLQAAGRVIRTHKDKGVIVFVDERFTTPHYRNLFPAHMRHYKVINDIVRLREELTQFWNDKTAGDPTQ